LADRQNLYGEAMPIALEPRHFLNVEDAHFLRDAVDATCRALDVKADDKAARAAISGRVADLARSGLRRVDAIRDRIVREARALADIAA
jgi:hypothetical protein